MATLTTQQISLEVGGKLIGPGDVKLTGVEQLQHATAGQLTFVASEKFSSKWPASAASAALVSEGIELEPGAGRALIMVDNADLAMAQVLALFAPPVPAPPPGIDPSARIDESARIGDGASIGPFCCVGPGTTVGAGAVLHPNVVLHNDCTVGADCVIWSGCVIRERCRIGDRCILHPNVTIGADGFGYRPSPDEQGRMKLVKIPQIGHVVLGDEVELGAATCVDRGKFSATVIGTGTKVDNLCQIGHNCLIGKSCVIAGMTAIGGSVTIGDGVAIGGRVGISDHTTIGDGAKVGAGSGVGRDIEPGGEHMGYPAQPIKSMMRQWGALRKLPDLVKMLSRSHDGH